MSHRKMGEALRTVSDDAKIHMMDVISAVISMSTVPPDAWRDLLLVYAANEAHEQGVERQDFETAAAVVIHEEWSTPNTRGRAAERNRKRD